MFVGELEGYRLGGGVRWVGGKEGERAVTHSERTVLSKFINAQGLGKQTQVTSNLVCRKH